MDLIYAPPSNKTYRMFSKEQKDCFYLTWTPNLFWANKWDKWFMSCLLTKGYFECVWRFFLNMELTESLDNLSFLKRMNRCWQDHCRQTVSVMFDKHAYQDGLSKKVSFKTLVFLFIDNDPKYLSLPGSYLCASELPTALHLVKLQFMQTCFFYSFCQVVLGG